MSVKLKNIAIAGAGGIGSHLTGMIFDFGVNREQFPFTDWTIDVYDDDAVDLSNLLHQNYKEEDIHTSKVKSMENRYAVTGVDRFMVAKDFDKYDLVFCCVDSMTFRKELYEYFWKNGKPKMWIDGRCQSRQGCVFNSTIAKEKLEKMLNDNKEREGCLLKAEKEAKIAHALPIVTAGYMLQTFLNYLRGDKKLPEKIFMI